MNSKEPSNNLLLEVGRYLTLSTLQAAIYFAGLFGCFLSAFGPFKFLTFSPWFNAFFVSYFASDFVVRFVLFHVVYIRWVYPWLVHLFTKQPRRRFGWRWTIITLIATGLVCGWFESSEQSKVWGKPISRFVLQPSTVKSAMFDCYYWDGYGWVTFPIYEKLEDDWDSSLGGRVDQPIFVPVSKKLKAGQSYRFRMAADVLIWIDVNQDDPERGNVILEGYTGGSGSSYIYGKVLNTKLYE